MNALLVEPGDAVALGEALTRIINDKQLASQLRLGGLARAKELSMRHLAEIYVDIYHKVLDELKTQFGSDLYIITDVCLCAYTTHGHCG
ncbi:MAG: hypothetical protein ACKPAJ_01840, partial [Actinomycetota bacterium]